jgi:hypothetical protein
MSLEIVVDNTVSLDIYNFKDIAACARRFANQLEAGEQGEPTRLVIVAQHGDGVSTYVWGENADPHQMMGLLEAAKLTVFADLVVGDDED